jgi:hypothetical protein
VQSKERQREWETEVWVKMVEIKKTKILQPLFRFGDGMCSG